MNLLPIDTLVEISYYLDVRSFVAFTSITVTSRLVRTRRAFINGLQYKYPCGYIGWCHQTCDKETSRCEWCLRTQCKSLFITQMNLSHRMCRFGCLYKCSICKRGYQVNDVYWRPYGVKYKFICKQCFIDHDPPIR